MGLFHPLSSGSTCTYSFIMFTARRKILKPAGAKPDETELNVARALFDLETNNSELKADLKHIFFISAKEVDVAGGKKAIIVLFPYVLIPNYHRIQPRLVRELEKKFSGKHFVFVAQRRILRKPTKLNRVKKQKRPRSRTLTAVHDAMLEDVVFPSEIVGKRLRVRLDGSQLTKVLLDPKDKPNSEHKLDTFTAVYKKLTGKEAQFMYGPTLPVD